MLEQSLQRQQPLSRQAPKAEVIPHSEVPPLVQWMRGVRDQEAAYIRTHAEQGTRVDSVYGAFFEALSGTSRTPEVMSMVFEDWMKSIQNFITRARRQDPALNPQAAHVAGLKAFLNSNPPLLSQTMEEMSRRRDAADQSAQTGARLRFLPSTEYIINQLYAGYMNQK